MDESRTAKLEIIISGLIFQFWPVCFGREQELAGLVVSKPTKVIREFHQHIERLLHSTVTDAPVSLVELEKSASKWEARLSLGWKAHDPRAVLLKPMRWYLALSQNVAAIKGKSGSWHLRTLQYSYRLQEETGLDSRWFFRFEYKSREVLDTIYPRHHLHIPHILDCGSKTVNLADVHIPTGWVTIEELIRFLINELGVRPKRESWDSTLRKSEEKFREWTQRSI